MTTPLRNKLATTALCSLLGVTSQQALAFDSVNWNWNNDINETVDENVNININNDPTGLVQVEKLQMHIGDVTASSNVSGINNNAPGGEDVALIDQTVNLQASFDDNEVGNPITSVTGTTPNLTISNGSGNVDNNNEQVNLSFDLDGEVPVINTGVRNAIDLPEVASSATAVGNNQTIDSDVAVNIHDGQFLFGGFTGGDVEAGVPQSTASNVLDESGNTHTDIATLLTLGGALGLLQPAEISATSSVSDILNASVDSTATAVGNNMAVNVAAATPEDKILLADITQFGYANISATSTVSDVTVDNYANMSGAGFGPLSDPQKPLISSVATAVGNNATIKVGPVAP